MSKSTSKRKASTPASKRSVSKSYKEDTDDDLPSRSSRRTPSKVGRPSSKRERSKTPSRTGEKRNSSSIAKKTKINTVKQKEATTDHSLRRKSPYVSISHSTRKAKAIPRKEEKKKLRTKVKIKKEESYSESSYERSRRKTNSLIKIKEEPKTQIISAQKIKEEPDNEDSSEEIPIKKTTPQGAFRKKDVSSVFSYGVNTQEITEEIERIFKRIEDKKKVKGELLHKKRERKEDQKLKRTAKDYQFTLQTNPNIKSQHFANLSEIAEHPIVSNTELLLSLIEIASNSTYYLLDYSNRSKMFWEDILQYKTPSKIFNGYKSETLRKYWRILSKYDAEKISDLLKLHRKFLESRPIKLGTIVTSIAQFFEGNIDNIEEYIKSIQVDVRKQEIFEHEYKDPSTGMVTKVKDVLTTIKKRKKYEPGYKRQFIPQNKDLSLLEEIYGKNENKTDYQNVMQSLAREDSSKIILLHQYREEERRRLMQINEEDKFVFKVIDKVLTELCSEFPQFTRDYIFDLLVSNSMNIGRTYLSLTDHNEKNKLCFTSLDDNVILTMKGSAQYIALIESKGKDLVEEREDFLKH